MYSTPLIENVPLSDLPAYTGRYIRCWVHHVDPNTNAKYEKYISEEEAAFLRNLYYNHKIGLRNKSASLAEKVKSLEQKDLVERRSGRYYLSLLATNAEYTMVPRLLFAKEFTEEA